MTKKYTVAGYCKVTGAKKTIEVIATSSRHALTLSFDHLSYPRIVYK